MNVDKFAYLPEYLLFVPTYRQPLEIKQKARRGIYLLPHRAMLDIQPLEQGTVVLLVCQKAPQHVQVEALAEPALARDDLDSARRVDEILDEL
jgi:hypothetical protein